ncbi:hypothetical protein IJG29_02895 [Candidatus Saccharibacteria bacterium]|nr:hypothetical protein [Candidatus Saccharibacteria bacterium]
MPNKYDVHIEDSCTSKPRPHEKCAASILANHFKSDVIFLKTRQSKNPDLYVIKTNIRWELKSPIGKGKRTIQNNLREANKQSENIIIDFSRIRLSEKQGISRTKEYLRTERHSIKRLKIITKSHQIIDILNK